MALVPTLATPSFAPPSSVLLAPPCRLRLLLLLRAVLQLVLVLLPQRLVQRVRPCNGRVIRRRDACAAARRVAVHVALQPGLLRRTDDAQLPGGRLLVLPCHCVRPVQPAAELPQRPDHQREGRGERGGATRGPAWRVGPSKGGLVKSRRHSPQLLPPSSSLPLQPTTTTWVYTCYAGYYSSSVTTLTCNPDSTTGLAGASVAQCAVCPVGEWGGEDQEVGGHRARTRLTRSDTGGAAATPKPPPPIDPRSLLLHGRRRHPAVPARHLRRPGRHWSRLLRLQRPLPGGLLVRAGLDVADAEPVRRRRRVLPHGGLCAHHRRVGLLLDAHLGLRHAAHGPGEQRRRKKGGMCLLDLAPSLPSLRRRPAPPSAPALAASCSPPLTSRAPAAPSRAAP